MLLRAGYAMPSTDVSYATDTGYATDVGYAATNLLRDDRTGNPCLRARYAMAGTEVLCTVAAYARATQYLVFGDQLYFWLSNFLWHEKHLSGWQTPYRPTGSQCKFSSTDRVYDAIALLCEAPYSPRLCCHGCATRCPVLTSAMLLPGEVVQIASYPRGSLSLSQPRWPTLLPYAPAMRYPVLTSRIAPSVPGCSKKVRLHFSGQCCRLWYRV
eukprot:2181415-Rhodomonas_salina.1